MTLLRWIALLLFTQCFAYKDADFGLSLKVGITVTPDRLVLIIILLLAAWSFTSGQLQFSGLGKAGGYMLLFAFIGTVSALAVGRGAADYYRLFDFHYTPFIMFLLVTSIPHSHKKLEFVSLTFLAVGAYLAINGMFERFGPHALVWPQYILDPKVGIQFERTRGSFASSEALGAALVVTFLFYLLSSTRAEGAARSWAYVLTPVTMVTIYATNQRAAWTCGSCSLPTRNGMGGGPSPPRSSLGGSPNDNASAALSVPDPANGFSRRACPRAQVQPP